MEFRFLGLLFPVIAEASLVKTREMFDQLTRVVREFLPRGLLGMSDSDFRHAIACLLAVDGHGNRPERQVLSAGVDFDFRVVRERFRSAQSRLEGFAPWETSQARKSRKESGMQPSRIKMAAAHRSQR